MLYQFLHFFCSGGQLLKERICSTRSKFFPLRVDLFGKVSLSSETKWKSGKLMFHTIMAEKYANVPIRLNNLPFSQQLYKKT